MPKEQKQTKRKIYECLRCGHVWLPRATTEEVKLCPKCKSVHWDKPKAANS